MRDPTAVATAIVIAAAPAAGGDCAALLPWEGATVLARLLGQLETLGIHDVRVLTRPAYEAAVRDGRGRTACASRPASRATCARSRTPPPGPAPGS